MGDILNETERSRGSIYAEIIMFVVALALLAFVALPSSAWDLLAFNAAAITVRDGVVSAAWLPPQATSLFDVTSDYFAAVTAITGSEGSETHVTGFVSPPPAILFGWVLSIFPWWLSVILGRLVLVFPVTAVLVYSTRRLVDVDDDRAMAIALLWLFSIPSLAYVIMLGQPSLWLIPAVAASLYRGRWFDYVSGTLLGLLVCVKLGPLIVLPCMWWLGRRRLVITAICTVLIGVALSLLVLPLDCWQVWWRAMGMLSSHMLVDFNNLSFGALAYRLLYAPISEPWVWQSPGLRVIVIAFAMRTGLLLWVGYLLWRGRHQRGAIRLAWAVWLVATPLLWDHYLVALLPLLAYELATERNAARWWLTSLTSILVSIALFLPGPAELAAWPGGIIRGLMWLCILPWLVKAP